MPGSRNGKDNRRRRPNESVSCFPQRRNAWYKRRNKLDHSEDRCDRDDEWVHQSGEGARERADPSLMGSETE